MEDLNNQKIIYSYNGKEYDVTHIVNTINNDLDGTKQNNACRMTLELFGVKTTVDFESIFNDIIEKYCPDRFDRRLGDKSPRNILTPSPQKTGNTPKCPTCHSTNIHKINRLNRGLSISIWGIFSNKINKTYECDNCGYTW